MGFEFHKLGKTRTPTKGCGLIRFESIEESNDFRSFDKKDCSELGSKLHKLFLTYYLVEKNSRYFTLGFLNPFLEGEIDKIFGDKIKKH